MSFQFAQFIVPYPFVGLISFWNPATSYSPGRFSPCCIDPGNSHSRGPWPLFAIPDAPPACFRHWRRQAPVPQGAHGWKPNQVQCCTWLKTARKQLSPGRFSPCCIDPGNSHSRALRSLPAIPDAPPRCFAHWARSASVPPAARDGKPNQVQCCTRLKMAREENSRRAKKKPSHKAELFLWNPATSYSPGPSPAKYHRR